jgi:TolB-like protein/Flp pilus assembly protein TadD
VSIQPGPATPVPVGGAAPAASVAILAFADLSPEHDQDYFCEGIAEEIVNALCFVRGLRVAARTSAAQYKGRSVDVREIGRALGVGAVLEGSVRKAGDRVRITAQLVNSADGYHLWSESFDRRLEDVFATQTEIAQKLVAALQVSLTTQETELLERGGTRNAQAYDFYLRGQAYLRDGTAVTLPKAVATFRAAIERDPQFAQAHAGIANALALEGIWRLDITPQEIELAFAESARALELEPRMPEAFVARACLMSMQGRAAEADAAFEKAIELNPASFDAHHLYGRHAFATGEFAKAERHFEAAHRLRPDDYQLLCMLSGALEALGRSTYREVARRAMEAIERHLEIEPDDGRAMQLGTVQAAKLGDAARADALKQRALALRPNDFATFYNLACAETVLGRRDEALALLDRGVQSGRGNLGWIEHDPDFASLRGDPRFEAIVSRLRAAMAADSA